MKCEECKYFDKTERICYYMGENRCVDNEQQTEDAISRQAVVDEAVYTETEEGWCGYTVDVEDIQKLPSVKPQEPKTDVLNKIRADIMQLPTISFNANDIYKADALAIIDKYKSESEVESC